MFYLYFLWNYVYCKLTSDMQCTPFFTTETAESFTTSTSQSKLTPIGYFIIAKSAMIGCTKQSRALPQSCQFSSACVNKIVADVPEPIIASVSKGKLAGVNAPLYSLCSFIQHCLAVACTMERSDINELTTYDCICNCYNLVNKN